MNQNEIKSKYFIKVVYLYQNQNQNQKKTQNHL